MFLIPTIVLFLIWAVFVGLKSKFNWAILISFLFVVLMVGAIKFTTNEKERYFVVTILVISAPILYAVGSWVIGIKSAFLSVLGQQKPDDRDAMLRAFEEKKKHNEWASQKKIEKEQEDERQQKKWERAGLRFLDFSIDELKLKLTPELRGSLEICFENEMKVAYVHVKNGGQTKLIEIKKSQDINKFHMKVDGDLFVLNEEQLKLSIGEYIARNIGY